MIQQRIQALDDEKLLGFIADFEQFEKVGQIGDCSLRAEAEELGEEFKAPHNVVMWMQQVAFESYRALGNSMAVPVIRWIGRQIERCS